MRASSASRPTSFADFTGRGAGRYARAHNVSLSTRDLRTRRGTGGGAADVRSFADDTENRISDLEVAVRAAEQMPAARRRSARAAIAAERDRIETRLARAVGSRQRPPDDGGLRAGRFSAGGLIDASGATAMPDRCNRRRPSVHSVARKHHDPNTALGVTGCRSGVHPIAMTTLRAARSPSNTPWGPPAMSGSGRLIRVPSSLAERIHRVTTRPRPA